MRKNVSLDLLNGVERGIVSVVLVGEKDVRKGHELGDVDRVVGKTKLFKTLANTIDEPFRFQGTVIHSISARVGRIFQVDDRRRLTGDFLTVIRGLHRVIGKTALHIKKRDADSPSAIMKQPPQITQEFHFCHDVPLIFIVICMEMGQCVWRHFRSELLLVVVKPRRGTQLPTVNTENKITRAEWVSILRHGDVQKAFSEERLWVALHNFTVKRLHFVNEKRGRE